MCPGCIATLALIAAGATSTGGLTALVVHKLRANRGAKKVGAKAPTRGENHGPSENRIAG